MSTQNDLPAVAAVKRTGRVGAYPFNICLQSTGNRRSAEVGSFPKDGLRTVDNIAVGKMKIDKSRACNFHR